MAPRAPSKSAPTGPRVASKPAGAVILSSFISY